MFVYNLCFWGGRLDMRWKEKGETEGLGRKRTSWRSGGKDFANGVRVEIAEV